MSEPVEQIAEAPLEQVQITLRAGDTPEVRAQKSWEILGGDGPVHPTFQKIFEVYHALDKQLFEQEMLSNEAPSDLMVC